MLRMKLVKKEQQKTPTYIYISLGLRLSLWVFNFRQATVCRSVVCALPVGFLCFLRNHLMCFTAVGCIAADSEKCCLQSGGSSAFVFSAALLTPNSKRTIKKYRNMSKLCFRKSGIQTQLRATSHPWSGALLPYIQDMSGKSQYYCRCLCLVVKCSNKCLSSHWHFSFPKKPTKTPLIRLVFFTDSFVKQETALDLSLCFFEKQKKPLSTRIKISIVVVLYRFIEQANLHEAQIACKNILSCWW